MIYCIVFIVLLREMRAISFRCGPVNHMKGYIIAIMYGKQLPSLRLNYHADYWLTHTGFTVVSILCQLHYAIGREH